MAKTFNNPALRYAVAMAGGPEALAKKLGVSRQAVYSWNQIPIRHVLTVEKLFKLNRSKQRPDIYPPGA